MFKSKAKSALVAHTLLMVAQRQKFTNYSQKSTLSFKIATEIVLTYLSNSIMAKTLETIRQESENHMKQRHDNKWVSRNLRINPSFDPVQFLLSKRNISEPKPEDTRKIRVRVKKSKDGYVSEDPRDVLCSPNAISRVSQQDKHLFAGIKSKFNKTKSSVITGDDPSVFEPFDDKDDHPTPLLKIENIGIGPEEYNEYTPQTDLIRKCIFADRFAPKKAPLTLDIPNKPLEIVQEQPDDSYEEEEYVEFTYYETQDV